MSALVRVFLLFRIHLSNLRSQMLCSLLGKIKTHLCQGAAVRDVAILTLGTTLAQLVTVLAMPMLSRLYTPAEFGLLAVFMGVVAVVATFVTLRYEINILIPKINQEAEQVVFLSLSLAGFVGLLVSMIAWILPYAMRDSLGVGVLKEWLTWACLIGLCVATTATAFGWLNRVQLYKKMAQLRILQSLLFSGAALFFGAWGFKDGLLVAQVSSVLLVVLLIGRYLPTPSWSYLRSIPSLAYKYRDTPKYILPTALLDAITLQLPIILIVAWYGTSEAGQFSLAWRVLILPASFVGVAIGQVFFQRFSAIWPDAQRAWALLIKTWKILALIGFLPMIVLVIFGENFFSLIFGPNWAESGKMAAVLAPMLFASLLHSPTSTTSIVLGLQRTVFFLAIAILIYRPLSLYIGWRLGNIYLGLAIYCALEIVQILIFQYAIYKKIKFRINLLGETL